MNSWRTLVVPLSMAALLLGAGSASEARVTRIVIDETLPMPTAPGAGAIAYERFALQATALGIRNAFVNQPVEVSSVRPQFAEALGVANRRPDLVVRFGRGPTLPMSMRRPVESVLI